MGDYFLVFLGIILLNHLLARHEDRGKNDEFQIVLLGHFPNHRNLIGVIVVKVKYETPNRFLMAGEIHHFGEFLLEPFHLRPSLIVFHLVEAGEADPELRRSGFDYFLKIAPCPLKHGTKKRRYASFGRLCYKLVTIRMKTSIGVGVHLNLTDFALRLSLIQDPIPEIERHILATALAPDGAYGARTAME